MLTLIILPYTPKASLISCSDGAVGIILGNIILRLRSLMGATGCCDCDCGSGGLGGGGGDGEE